MDLPKSLPRTKTTPSLFRVPKLTSLFRVPKLSTSAKEISFLSPSQRRSLSGDCFLWVLTWEMRVLTREF